MTYKSKCFHFHNLYQNEQLSLPIGEVFQVSELQLPSGGEIARHNQWCDEITYVLSGSSTIVSGGIKEIIGKGEVHYIKKGVDHEIIANKNESIRFICVGFIPNEECEANQILKSEMKDREALVVRDDGNIKALSQLLLGEFYSWDDFSIQFANAYINQILLTLCRILRGEKGSIQGNLREENSINHTIYKIIRYIDMEYINIDSIKSVAAAMNYNECYVSHLFAQKMGISAKKYLMTKKISYAVELLKTTKMSIEEISVYLNFSSVQTFRRVFKQYTGKVPTEFREGNDKV